MKGYKLAFGIHAIPYLEPSFANIVQCEKCEVHGVLTKLSKEDAGKQAARPT